MRLLNGLQGVEPRLLEQETRVIGDELVFEGKMDRVLGTLRVGDHDPDHAAVHEKYFVGYLARPAQYGLPPEGFGITFRQEVGQFRFRNVNHLPDCLPDLVHLPAVLPLPYNPPSGILFA